MEEISATHFATKSARGSSCAGKPGLHPMSGPGEEAAASREPMRIGV